MISLVTLAHRVSNIYKRYASVHAALFSFSLAQLKIKFWRANEPAYCEFERKLMQFDQELMDVRTIINDEDQLESGNTVSREFAFALDVYIIALSDAIKCLSMICKHRCRELNGEEKYDIKQNWADRHDYDNKIQQYRRLGERLTDLFKRL
ncbi:MAG: hypothetical protein KDI83_07900 [Gammaproteobacteria bacterium]|nr:hypothetical protein [Gammaproteobacteria bacterium]